MESLTSNPELENSLGPQRTPVAAGSALPKTRARTNVGTGTKNTGRSIFHQSGQKLMLRFTLTVEMLPTALLFRATFL